MKQNYPRACSITSMSKELKENMVIANEQMSSFRKEMDTIEKNLM